MSFKSYNVKTPEGFMFNYKFDSDAKLENILDLVILNSTHQSKEDILDYGIFIKGKHYLYTHQNLWNYDFKDSVLEVKPLERKIYVIYTQTNQRKSFSFDIQ